MSTRLQEINLVEFTGGFNAWRNQFNLAANESPDMLNMDIDPRGGFYTRKGWTRWNAGDALGDQAYFDLPGTSGNYVEIADAASLDLVGDIEIVVRVALDDWNNGAHQALVSKCATPFSSVTGYVFEVNDTGVLRATVGNGATAYSSVSTVAPTVTDGVTYWLKVTYELDNGANREVKFYQAADQSTEPSSWTQVGSTVTSSQVSAIAPNALSLYIGQETDGGGLAAGKFYRAIIRDGIAGTTVFDTGGDDIPRDTAATGYTTTTGQTATIAKTGASFIVVADWEPRNTFTHSLSTGSYVIYVTNGGQIENAGTNGVFSPLEIAGPTTVAVTADPHLADFAAWGDYLYIACGSASASHLRNGTGTPTSITDAYGNYNDDYTTPDAIGAGAFPRCDFIETHSSYVFAAYIKEGTVYPNRLRWSHPSQPENWATLDYIDIDSGGGKITGLRSFQDHLLIFKTDSIWALYGYDSDSWQLVRVSAKVGAPNTTAVAASETAVYFYSTTTNGGIYAYNGNSPVYLSQNLRTITEEISETAYDDIWLGWVGKRLWCSLPWLADGARTGDEQTIFVFDPLVGDGAWVVYRPASGSLTSIVEGSDVYAQYPLAVICGHATAACLVQLDFADAANDKLVEALTADPFDAYYTTGWQNAGWPERRKSWRRPRFILERVDETVQINLDTYFDYNESSPMRSHTVTVNSDGTAFWRETGALEDGGFDWGDGTLWGAAGSQGSIIERGVTASVALGGLGVNRAIQLRFSTNPTYLGKAWGINAMTLKYILRRFTT